MEVCDYRSRLTFQILVSEDVISAETSVHAFLRKGAGAVVTHILTASFRANVVQSRYDGYFYTVGNTPVTIIQDSLETTWMVAVDYFHHGVTPSITQGALTNLADSKAGYLTFSAVQGRIISSMSLMVDMSAGGKGYYAPLLPSEGGMIVPRLYYDYVSNEPRQVAAYDWSVRMNWTISGFPLQSPQALEHFSAADGVVGETKIVVDTELSIDTPCRADVVFFSLTREHVCPLLQTTNTTTFTSTTTTLTTTTTSTTNTTSTTSTTTTITTVTTVTTFGWPAADSGRSGLTTIIRGSINLQVPNADFYLLDDVAQDATSAGIADAFGIPSSYVTIKVSKVRRRLTSSIFAGRRLVGIVKIDYTAKIPSTAPAYKTKEVAQIAIALSAAIDGRLEAEIRRRVQEAKGSTFEVSVTSKTRPIVEMEAEESYEAGTRRRKKGNSGAWLSTRLSLLSVFLICVSLSEGALQL